VNNVILLGKTPLKAQNDYIFQKFGRRHGLFGLPWLHVCLYLNAFWLVTVNCKLCFWSVQNLSG